MSISIRFQSLRDNTVGEYATRFLFGGAISVIAGLTAKRYGPIVAGLLLAFPAIFPASATLLADHEKQKKKKIDRDGTLRGRAAAAVDGDGTMLGCVGLLVFALAVWRMLPHYNAALTLGFATALWLVVSVLGWLVRRKL
jgi:uncharacterized membrane protein (GlpM family)